MRVAIVDDHVLVRGALKAILEDEADIVVVAVADSGVRALEILMEHRPDVLVLDLTLPDIPGLEILRRLEARRIAPSTLIYSGYTDEASVFAALDLGVAGYLDKADDGVDLVEAIRGIAQGETGWFSRRIAARLVARRLADAKQVSKSTPSLSPREREILAMIASGLGNAAIAQRLGLANGTVKNQVRGIYGKLEIHERSRVMTWAWQHGYRPPDTVDPINPPIEAAGG